MSIGGAGTSRSPDPGQLLVAGAFGGAAWYLLRRLTPGERTEIDDVVWGDGERLSFRRSLGTSVISEIVIGMGASVGGGLAAVYNVPLGGALFTAEIMMGTITLPVALPALACSGIATVTAWLYLPRHATYLGVPSYHFTVPLLVWALLAGPLIGLAASG
jgi:CIC family chloride channel protein